MNVEESLPRDVMRLFVWYPLRWAVAALPVRAGIAVLRSFGDMHFALSRGKRALLVENLSRIRGRAAIGNDTVVREYLRNHYIDRLLIFIFPKFGADEVKRLVEIKGLVNLDNALKRGKGAILVHGHIGPVHLPLVSLARLGYRMKQIGLPSDEGLSWIGRNVAFRLRMKYEGKMPAEIIMADGFLRGAFKWLASNGVIMITGDGSGTEKRLGRHEVFDFCGQKVYFPLGPALLSEKTGAAILPMFITPGEGGKLYCVNIGAELNPEGKETGSAKDVTGRFVSRLEDCVRRYPFYMHFLDRFMPGAIIAGE